MANQLSTVPNGVWSSGICDCCSDMQSCICATFCPCVMVGRVAEIASDGFTDSCTACCLWYLVQVCCGCGCLYSMGYRNRLRQKYLLPATPCNDCCTHTFCPCCAFAQEYRELKARGWEPKIGYAGNVRRFQAASSQVAPGSQQMGR